MTMQAAIQTDAERMQVATDALKVAQHRCIPTGDTQREELVAIRTLLRTDRVGEAKERLDALLNKYHECWRAG